MSAPAPGTRAAEVVAGGLRASPLAAGIWRRYVTAPGVIDVESMLARPRQIVGLAGERLPLLSSVLGAVPRRTVTTAAGPEAMPLPRWGMSADSGNAPGTAASGFSSRSQALPPTPALAEALGVSPAALASVMGGSGPTAVPARKPALDPRGPHAPEPPTAPPVLGRAVLQRRRAGGGATPGPPPGPLAASGGQAAPFVPAASLVVGEPARSAPPPLLHHPAPAQGPTRQAPRPDTPTWALPLPEPTVPPRLEEIPPLRADEPASGQPAAVLVLARSLAGPEAEVGPATSATAVAPDSAVVLRVPPQPAVPPAPLPMVQRRAPDPAPAGQDRDAHRDSVPAAQPVPRQESTATAPVAAGPAPFVQAARQQRVAPADVDRIADRVYGLLVRRVRGERERRGF